jgi:hypothetical protein
MHCTGLRTIVISIKELHATFGEARNYQRSRMQLLDAGHGHEWKDAAP